MNHAAPFVRKACLLLSLLAATAPGFAADTSPAQGCRDDMRKLCSGVKPGGGRALACLQEREADLSPTCRAALPALKRCAQEIKAVCGDTGPREARSCLRNNADKLSAECRQMAPAR